MTKPVKLKLENLLLLGDMKKVLILLFLIITAYSQEQDSSEKYIVKIGITAGSGMHLNAIDKHYVKDFGAFFEDYYKNNWLTGGAFNYTILPIFLDDSTYSVLEYFRLTPYFGKNLLNKKISVGIGPQAWFLNKATAYVNDVKKEKLDSIRVFRDIWYRTVYGFNLFVRYNMRISKRFDGYFGASLDYSITTPKDPIFWPIEWDIKNIGAARITLGVQYKMY